MTLDKVILSGYSDYSASFYRPEGSNDQITSLDTDRLAQGVTNVLLAITPRLKDFHSLLVEPPKVCSVKTILYFLHI